MKKMKGILALALALAMICSSLAALAEEAPAEEPAEEILTETAAEEAVEEAPEEPVEEQAEEPVGAPALSGAAPAGDGEELNGTADNGKPTTDDQIKIQDDYFNGGFMVKDDTTNTTIINGNNPGTVNVEGVQITYTAADAAAGDPAAVAIDGNVNADDIAVYIISSYAEDLNVTIDGNITGARIGLDVETQKKNTETKVIVNGDVGATEEYSAFGILTCDEAGSSTVTVNGDVTSQAYGIYMMGNDTEGVSIVNVTGDVTSLGRAYTVYLSEGEGDKEVHVGGNVTTEDGDSTVINISNNGVVTVAGDVGGGKTGLVLQYDGERDVLVEGTISGKMGVRLGKEFNGDNTDLTVWQIASTKEDATEADLVVNDDFSHQLTDDDVTTFCQQSIHYIVKLLQPTEGGTVAAQKEDGSALDKHHEKETAREGDKVYLNIQAGYGYRILKALNGDTELDKDESGFFYKVKRGGGILLSAVLEKIVQPEPEPEPEPEPAPKPDPKPEPAPKPEPVPKDEPVQKDDPAPEKKTAKTGGTVDLLEVRDAGNRIRITFTKSGIFRVLMEDGTLERGTYKALNGRLVLNCGGRLVMVGENGTFTYTSQKHPEKKYDFRLDAGDLEKLISAVK